MNSNQTIETMAIREWEKSVTYTDDEVFLTETVDTHVSEHNDIKTRNDLIKKAVREFIGSRRNKGKFVRIT